MKDLFSCTVATDRQSGVAYLDGEIDLSTVDRLVDKLAPLASAGRHLIVDLSGLTFLATVGVSALADLQRKAHAAGGSLRLAAVPSEVWRMVAVTGMQDRFAVVTPLSRSVAACADNSACAAQPNS